MNKTNKAYYVEQSVKTFEQQFAHYRALVFEQFISPLISQQDDTQDGQHKPTILVVEDKEDEWFLVRWALLQQFPNVDVVWASSTLDTTAYLKKCLTKEADLPQLILVDLYLPTTKLGLGIVKTLKTHSLFQRIPLVTISRSDRAEDKVQAYNYASDYYIVKPTNYTGWKDAFVPLSKYLSDKDQ